MRIEDYGFIGDMHTGALVGANGSIDWLCLPRFDSGACFAALLGNEDNGHWKIAATDRSARVTQRYRPDTLIMETDFETATGAVRVIDCMPPSDVRHDVVRVVEGLRGSVEMMMKLVMRFDYGESVPWVRRDDGHLKAIAGPDALVLHAEVETRGENMTTCTEFTVEAGERKAFVLTWHPSHLPAPAPMDADEAIAGTEKFWLDWSSRCTYEGEWRDAVMRSLITLKALTFHPTGGIVAAATTSLPEHLGGVRNWDYRYCWLRDATFTMFSLMEAGYRQEASRWSDWLVRAAAGDPAQLQMLYGVAGERRIPEIEVPHLSGYGDSKPVRVGNAASSQFQLDVYGEILDSMHFARRIGLDHHPNHWHVERRLVEFVATHWMEPDQGIWEIRGPRLHFTHSKVMAWVALDRAVRAVEEHGLEGDVERWRSVRDEIHHDACTRGYAAGRGIFTQSYGSDRLDASLLMLPLVGFLPPSDPRMIRTIMAIRDELATDGFVYRYLPQESGHMDGLPPGEAAFLPCSFWLVDCLMLIGKRDEAREWFGRLLELRTPLGLLSEEYDCKSGRLLGNFPQAFSHVAMVNTAQNLSRRHHPAEERGGWRHLEAAADSG